MSSSWSGRAEAAVAGHRAGGSEQETTTMTAFVEQASRPRSAVPAQPRHQGLATIDEAIEEYRAGRMVIIVDDEGRENEGDLTMAAEFVTPDAIAFMARYGRGLICVPMTGERLDELQIPML